MLLIEEIKFSKIQHFLSKNTGFTLFIYPFCKNKLFLQDIKSIWGSHVNCYRCGRAMIYEKFYGPHEHFLGWKCIFCGEIIDQVILENRLQLRTGPATIARTRRR